MFKNMLLVQWRWTRWSVLLLSIAAIAITVWSVSVREPPSWQGTVTVGEAPTQWQGPSPLGERLQLANFWYHLVVFVAGFLLAMHAWRTDHAGRHVYALSLPISRWRYVLYRYGAGLLFGAITIMMLWLTAVVMASFIEVPPGLHVYPTGLALRVAIGMFTAYAFFFAVWNATPRTGYYTAAAVVLLILVSAIQWDPVVALRDSLRPLFNGIGLVNVFGGRWFLIDV